MTVAPEFVKRLQADLKVALAERDRPAVKAIRLLMSAVANAEAVDASEHTGGKVINPGEPVIAARADVPRRELSSDELAQVVAAELRDHDEHIAAYESHGQVDRAADLRAEREVLARYESLR